MTSAAEIGPGLCCGRAGEDGSPAIGDRTHEMEKERRAFVSYPLISAGSHMAMPGSRDRMTTATAISSTKGKCAPDDGAEADIGRDAVDDEDVEPTGGWIRPISITTAITTPNQIRSNPAAQRRQDDRRRHQDDRHRRQEEAEHHDHQQDRRQQQPFREVQRDDPCAAPWLMCR